MSNISISSLPPEDWDEMVQAAGIEANLQQLSFWGNLLAQWEEAVPHYVQFKDNGEILAQALFIERWSYDRVKHLKTSKSPTLTCFDGPVILRPGLVDEIIPIFLDVAESLGSKCRASTIQTSFSQTSRWAAAQDIGDHFTDRGYASQSWATYLVDLTPDEDTLFMNLAHAARKCIKRCRREGVITRTLTTHAEFLTEFLPCYNDMECASGRTPTHCDPAMIDGWEDLYTYFLAEKDGHPIAALGMFAVNGVATEIMSSISVSALKEKIPAQDLLHWELMLWAKRTGCHTYDLAGFNPTPKSPKEKGIARFKKKWGGEPVNHNVFRKETPCIGRRLRKFAAHIKDSAVARLCKKRL